MKNSWDFGSITSQGGLPIIASNPLRAVKREVSNRDLSDPDRLGGDLAYVEEIATTLGHDLSAEIQTLNEALAEHGPRGGDDDVSLGSGHRHDGCASSIESMFDALLE